MGTVNNESQEIFNLELKTASLKVGMFFRWDIVTEDGNVLISAGEKLTSDIMKKILAEKILTVYYQKPKVIIKEEKKKTVIPLKVFAQALDVMEELKISADKKIKIPEEKLNGLVDSFIEAIFSASGNVFLNLLEMKEHDNFLYHTAINTAILAIAFAKKIGYTEKGTKIIGIAGLLHNIGLLFIEPSIISNPNPSVEEYSILKQAPVIGAEYIKSETTFGKVIQNAVLSHYEKWDGTGYPGGLAGTDITETAQIISIASAYIGITCGKPHKKLKKPPWYAFTLIDKMSGIYFSSILTQLFTDIMPPILCKEPLFTVGQFIELNSGEIGTIVDTKNPYSLKPVISIYLINNEEVAYPIPLDLENDNKRFIRKIVTDENVIKRFENKSTGYHPQNKLTEEESDYPEPNRMETLAIFSDIRSKNNFLQIDTDLLEDDEASLRDAREDD